MQETANAIAGGDMSARVETTDERTEVGRLGASLNSMLGQIERAFAEREASEERLRRSWPMRPTSSGPRSPRSEATRRRSGWVRPATRTSSRRR